MDFPKWFLRLFEKIPTIKVFNGYNDRRSKKPTSKYAKFRRDVFALHKNKCCKCGMGTHKTFLTVHHLYSWKHKPDYRFDSDFAVLLCPEHHSEFHEIYGYVDFTPEDYFEYLGR